MEASTPLNKLLSFVVVTINVIARISFILLLIRAAFLMFDYFFSFRMPAFFEGNGDKALDDSRLFQISKLHYSVEYVLRFTLYMFGAYVCLLVVRLINRRNIAVPFHPQNVARLNLMSVVLLNVGGVSFIYNLHNNYLRQFQLKADHTADIQWIIAAGLVFIVSGVISKGIQKQAL
jgi:hypothetical protein